MNLEKTYRNNQVKNWLIISAFLLSVFSFSGFTISKQLTTQVSQTELELPDRQLSENEIVYFYQTYLQNNTANAVSQIAFNRLYKLHYNRLINNQLKSTIHSSSFEKIVALRYPIKTIPQNDEEENFNSNLG